ncbi:MAG: hypothetical protein PUE58_01925 [Lachnospiraceae bacterium]|nr:hypothetical protein [Lachnospiraceae bacterium]
MIVEKKIQDFLKARISVPIYMEKPPNPPKSYVIIERVGGAESNWISQGTFAIKSIGPTLYKAATLDHDVVTAMHDLTTIDNISGCVLNADTNFTDITTKEYRYQSTYLINYMED